MASSDLPDVLGAGDHASRPAATDVVAGATYSCSTHGLEYQSDGATWSTRSTFGAAGAYVAGGTDVAVADGGTGASTASAARTNLGLAIGTDVDAFASTVSQAEAEAGVATTVRNWTAQRVAQAIAALGGGGGGSDLVQVASGAGSIRIPGLAGSPDIRVAAANDDEFDTTDTSDPMTGWTTLGTPTAHDINSTVKSHYYIRQAATASTDIVGIYKAIPSTPFTVTAKLADNVQRADYNGAGLFVAAASPGALETVDYLHDSVPNRIGVNNWTNRTTYNSTPVAAITVGGGAMYLRCVVTTTTNIAWYYSHGGLVWRALVTGRNPGFTVGSVGLYCKSQNGTHAGEAAFDWIRFT